MKYTENQTDLDRRIRAHKLYSRATLEGIIEQSVAASSEEAGAAPLLDLGCGNGNYYSLFSRWPGGYVGVDVNEDLLRAFAQAHPGNKLLIRASMDALPGFVDGSFGAIYSVYSIYYTEQPKELIARLRRLLRPGGRLVVLGPGSGEHAPEIGANLSVIATQLQVAPGAEPAAKKNARLDNFRREIIPAMHATFTAVDVREVDTSLEFPNPEEWAGYVAATPEARERFPGVDAAVAVTAIQQHARARDCRVISKSMICLTAS